MCHPHYPLVSEKDLTKRQRWYVLQAPAAVETGRRFVPTVALVAANGGGSGRLKQCICSPTKHPGSFRCRHHHAEYVWGHHIR